MKFNNFSDNEVQQLGEAQETEFSIDQESLGILFRGFSDSLYSDKFGSIVREITSNCFDAHREVGQKEDVRLTMVQPNPFDEGKIIFQDFGPGLSPDRIKSIYSKYFASSKRDTNDQIGGFGIGAKSPLAYADSFQVLTRVDGIEYLYVVHRGEKVPVITLLSESSTDSANGTQVIIPIANLMDYGYFIDAVRKQLRYFDNITYNIPNQNLSNEYKIFKGKHWISRTGGTENNQLEICVGTVGYPIDFSALKHPDFEYSWDQRANFALLFEVGEISVTMNRESIEYNRKTVDAIFKKIELVKHELEDLKIIRNRTSNLEAYLKVRLNDNMLRIEDDCILESAKIVGKSSATYVPLENQKIPSDPFFFCYVHKSVGVDKSLSRTLRAQNVTRLIFRESLLKDHWLLNKVRNLKILRLRDRMNSMKDAYIRETYPDGVIVIKLNSEWIYDFKSMNSTLPLSELEATSNEYFKHMVKILNQHSESYDDLEIPEDWIEEYREGNRSTGKVRSKEVIPYKELFGDNDCVGFGMSEGTVRKILEEGKTVVYGASEDDDKLKEMYKFLLSYTRRVDTTGYVRSLKDYRFIKISKARMKLFENDKKAIHIQEFGNRMYSKIARNLAMSSEVRAYSSHAEIEPVVQKFNARFTNANSVIRAFKFEVDTDNQYLTYKGKQYRIAEVIEEIKRYNETYSMLEFVPAAGFRSGNEMHEKVKNYLNLIEFNSKLKHYA